PMIDPAVTPLTRRIILGLLLGGLLLLGYTVMHLFLVPVAWAGIIAYSTWPLYLRLRAAMRGNKLGSALLMTLLLSLAFVLPMLWLGAMLRGELTSAYSAMANYL